MNARAKGWCPGALRSMESGDGLIVRLRLSCNQASPDLLREIAALSQRFGNGALDLSARGNLQLRGVGAATLPRLTDKLREAGLLDASPEVESARNVLVSPFAGADPTAPFDVREDARALEREIAVNPVFWALPNKFGFSFDGGAYPLGDESDIRFVAQTNGAYRVHVGEFAREPLAREAVVAVAAELAGAFVALRAVNPALRRMRDAAPAVVRHGERGEADAAQGEGWLRCASDDGGGRTRRPTGDWLGAQVLGPAAFVGVALPFGRIAAPDLAALARLAAEAGGLSLRLTPWRAILIPSLSSGAAEAMTRAAARLDLILDPADPRLHVAACPGAPGCASALGETRAAATRLAPLAPDLHVSGCPKGCAHPAPSSWTAVAASEGYDLIRDGRADATPFARALSLDALAALLQEHAAR